MSFVEFLSQPICRRFALTLLHFLWQGLAVAILAAVIVRAFRVKHGNGRYTVYLLAFAAMVVCPVVTFTMIDISAVSQPDVVIETPPAKEIAIPQYAALPPIEAAPVLEVSPNTAIPAETVISTPVTFAPQPVKEDSLPLTENLSAMLDISMPWVPVIWMFGVIVLSVRLLAGFIGIHRLRRDLKPLPKDLSARVDSLSARLGMAGFSRVFISPKVIQAMAVGYFKPTVLLPAAMVTQMPADMLEAVIAHELAHIHRLDLWVNLAQRLVETLLFYHPAVWWLSNRLRSERELCCDAMAVKLTGQRLTYAKTLQKVTTDRANRNKPFLAAGLGQNTKPTLSRIRHILGLKPQNQNTPAWQAGLIAVLFLAAIAIPTTVALTKQSGKEDSSQSDHLKNVQFKIINEVTGEPIAHREVNICRFVQLKRKPGGPSPYLDRNADWFITVKMTDSHGVFYLDLSKIQASSIVVEPGPPFNIVRFDRDSDLSHTRSNDHIRSVHFAPGKTRLTFNKIYDLKKKTARVIPISGPTKEVAYKEILLVAKRKMSGTGKLADLSKKLSLPGSYLSMGQALAKPRFAIAAVCKAISEPGISSHDIGTLNASQNFKIVEFLTGGQPAQKPVSIGYEYSYHYSHDRPQRSIRNGETVIWVMGKRKHLGYSTYDYDGYKAFADTPENRKSVLNAMGTYNNELRKLVHKSIILPVRILRPQGKKDQSDTGLDFDPILNLTEQKANVKYFTESHGFHMPGVMKSLAGRRKIWAICAHLDYPNTDSRIDAAKELMRLKDPKTVPALLAAAKSNNYFVEGSENSSIHSNYRRNLKQALEKVTSLSLTPKGLKITIYKKNSQPIVIKSEDDPSYFEEDIDFKKVESWLNKKQASPFYSIADLNACVTVANTDLTFKKDFDVSIVIENNTGIPIMIDTTPDKVIKAPSETWHGQYQEQGARCMTTVTQDQDRDGQFDFFCTYDMKVLAHKKSIPFIMIPPGKKHKLTFTIGPWGPNIGALPSYAAPGPAKIRCELRFPGNGKRAIIKTEPLKVNFIEKSGETKKPATVVFRPQKERVRKRLSSNLVMYKAAYEKIKAGLSDEQKTLCQAFLDARKAEIYCTDDYELLQIYKHLQELVMNEAERDRKEPVGALRLYTLSRVLNVEKPFGWSYSSIAQLCRDSKKMTTPEKLKEIKMQAGISNDYRIGNMVIDLLRESKRYEDAMNYCKEQISYFEQDEKKTQRYSYTIASYKFELIKIRLMYQNWIFAKARQRQGIKSDDVINVGPHLVKDVDFTQRRLAEKQAQEYVKTYPKTAQRCIGLFSPHGQFSTILTPKQATEFYEVLLSILKEIEALGTFDFERVEPLPYERVDEMFERIRKKGENIDLKLIYQAMIGPQTTLRAEAASYLGTHGNNSSIPYLIDALADESFHVGAEYIEAGMATTRYRANNSLKKLTGKDFGFVWNDPKEKRAKAIKKWKNWWKNSKMSGTLK